MIKRSLLLLVSVVLFTVANAQDFTISELITLRSDNLTEFESALMDKGYDLSNIDMDYDRYVIFKKGDQKVILGYVRNDHSSRIDTVLIYKTRDLDTYKRLQAERAEDPAHPNITHFISDETYIKHVYVDGDICLHFRTRAENEAEYEVKIFPDNTNRYRHYATLNGDIDY